MTTRLMHICDVPATTGPPEHVENPLKPEKFAGKHERRLGRAVGMTQFGVNLVTLEPGSWSALRHWHEGEDEFVYVLAGRLILIDDNGEHPLDEGCIAGFPAGIANAHHLVNTSKEPATFLVAGSRRPGNDRVHYPDENVGPFSR